MARHTKGYRRLIQRLADAYDGVPDFEDEELKPWFADGVFYESWARGWYAWNKGETVCEVGLVAHDEYDYIACSPDGLIVDESLPGTGDTRLLSPLGNLEIKYRKTIKSFDEHAKVGETRTVKAQVQTQMLVCGTDWCDYVNYWRSDEHEKEKGHVQRIYRDEAYINNTLLPAFVRTMSDVNEELERREEYTK